MYHATTYSVRSGVNTHVKLFCCWKSSLYEFLSLLNSHRQHGFRMLLPLIYCVVDVAQFDSDLDYTDGDTHVWTVKHNYTVGDTYTLNIDFQNWVSTLTVDVEFHAIEEIAPLE